ncbi:MAG: SgcJ/EcaC family oxidoreductase [Pseudomonadota bacterium]
MALPARPEDFPAAFAAAWMARDAASLAALFAEDADFVNVVGIWWRNRAAIEKAHHYALTSFFAETDLVPGLVRVRPLGADHTIVHCRMLLKGQSAPDGSPAGDRRTVLIFVLARTDAGWQAVAAQNTDVVPGAETYVAGESTLTPQDYRR